MLLCLVMVAVELYVSQRHSARYTLTLLERLCYDMMVLELCMMSWPMSCRCCLMVQFVVATVKACKLNGLWHQTYKSGLCL